MKVIDAEPTISELNIELADLWRQLCALHGRRPGRLVLLRKLNDLAKEIERYGGKPKIDPMHYQIHLALKK
ncbi:MAG: hypothetical protein WA048_00250 [Minisyncoccia bacterium]